MAFSVKYYGPGVAGTAWGVPADRHQVTGFQSNTLRMGDVALSDDVARALGLTPGQTQVFTLTAAQAAQYGVPPGTYRYADSSFLSEGHPNTNAFELWMPKGVTPNNYPGGLAAAPAPTPGTTLDNPFADPSWSPGPQTAPTPGEITDNPFLDPSWLPSGSLPPAFDPFQYTPPSGDVSLPPSPIDFSGALTSPAQQFDTPWNSTWQPSSDLSSMLQAPSSSLDARPGFMDLSSLVAPGSMLNPPTNEAMSPTLSNWWDTPQNVPTNELMGPSETGFAPQNVPTNEQMAPDLANYWDYSSPGEVTDNPFADPSWTTPINESSPGAITDNPFADPSWLPPSEAAALAAAGGTIGGAGAAGGTVGGAGMWQNIGYGHDSPFGAGAAGPGGAGFGGYGGLGGSGAPQFSTTNDPSQTPMHGGVDPTSDGGPPPGQGLEGLHSTMIGVSESAQSGGGEANDAVDAALMAAKAAAPKQYPFTWARWKNPFPQGSFSQRQGPNALDPVTYVAGGWYPATYTTDPSLQTAMPGSPQFTPPSNVIPFPTIPTNMSPSDAVALLTGTHG